MSDEITPSGLTVDGSTQLGVVHPKLQRAVDLSAAFILLVIILPLGCLIILSIAIAGQRPFYAQTRMGHGRRKFGYLKFTTTRGDASVTGLGLLLRSTGLDELPQLINVLVGDMSFVGPYPVTDDEITRFYTPSEAAAYFSARPGLTGSRFGEQ